MKFFFIFYFFLLVQISTAQTFRSVQMLKGNHSEYIIKVAFTPKNERIIVGNYDSDAPVTFPSCAGKTVVVRDIPDSSKRVLDCSSVFVAKYSETNCLLWVATAFAERGIFTTYVATDKAGNSIICGNFKGKAVFYSADKKNKKMVQGFNATYSHENEPYNCFVAKYDAKGHLLWVKIGTGTENSGPFQIETDKENNIFVRIYCVGDNISFDKFSLLQNNLSKPYLYNLGIVILKYKPNGEEEWITYGGDKSGSVTHKNMHLNALGNVVLDMYMYGDSLHLFNTDGNKYKQITPEKGVYRIELGKKGEILHCTLMKNFENKTVKTIETPNGETYMIMKSDNEFNETPFLEWRGKHVSKGYDDIYFAKLNKQGNTEWFIQIGGQYDEVPFDILLDKKGNIILSGRFDLETHIKGVSGKTHYLTSKMRGLFIASFTPDGALNWAENCGTIFYNGRLTHPTLQLAVNAKNQLFMYGLINMPSQFGKFNVGITGELDPIHAVSQSPIRHETYAYADPFIAQYDLGVSIEKEKPTIAEPIVATLSEKTKQKSSNTEKNTNNSVLLYPNPVGKDIGIVNALLTLSADADVSWRLFDATGKLLIDETGKVRKGDIHKQFSLNNCAAGIYFLRITIGKDLIIKQIILL